MRVLVTHSWYGCDTGCCGHIVTTKTGAELFSFSHPCSTESFREYAERLVAEEYGPEHVADLDWENSVVLDD